MNIPLNVQVHCTDGLAGHSTILIVNPIDETITHFVLMEHNLSQTERLVPIQLIKEATPRLILLDCTLADLENVEPFLETQFFDGRNIDWFDFELPKHAVSWPFHVYDKEDTYGVDVEHIPPEELAIRRGAPVKAIDGRIGVVEAFLVDATDGHITHLALQHGHLWGKKHITLPVSAIARFAENTVYLNLDKAEIESLTPLAVGA